ncbi:hypothetical protein GCM10022277_36630 [Litoribacillus peritrichatus]|uniref:Knr4/Smi1-like domain-containing protein n=1 Tax=Litoribacillus peritrichatus TaxID=718191 RepID=A0ABP7N4I2_9GAMM
MASTSLLGLYSLLITNQNGLLCITSNGCDLLKDMPDIAHIHWRPLDHELNMDAIHSVEQTLGIVFPTYYLDFIRACGGFDAGRDFIYPSAMGNEFRRVLIEFNHQGRLWQQHLETLLSPDEPGFISDISEMQYFLEGEMPSDDKLIKLVPITVDNGNMFICLDFRESATEPSIAFVNVADELAVHPIATSFMALLKMLTFDKN